MVFSLSYMIPWYLFRLLPKMASPGRVEEEEDSLQIFKEKLSDCISLLHKMSAMERLAVRHPRAVLWI